MDAFSPKPPDWMASAVHALKFCCPRCSASAQEAKAVWINRRSPVHTEAGQRIWQEGYRCGCGCSWWAWSNERPKPEDL